MSLLLPEKLFAGLFPGQCWLTRAGGVDKQAIVIDGANTAADLVAVLDEMLSAEGPTLRKGAKVSLMVSDSFAALAALPWHEKLTAPQEIKAYAHACFEKQSLPISDGWAMHAEFRAPGSMGLAYALPASLVATLIATLAKRGLRLDRVLPATAQTYWRIPPCQGAGQQLVLLRERDRIGAMVFDRYGLQGLDVEAVTGDDAAATNRLLMRVAAYFPSIGKVISWSATGQGDDNGNSITPSLPDAALVIAKRNVWS